MGLIPAYREKATFGDMDILCANPPDTDKIARALDAVEVVHNKTVSSLGILVEQQSLFQVDIIAVPQAQYRFAFRYFAYNDLGNLIGRVAHKMGFKFGHLGLRYVLRNPQQPERVILELLVTDDWERALSFLGYDPLTYQAGYDRNFSTLEDIFKYAASSIYFDADAYLYGNISHKMRVRDRKRPTYLGFLEWLETQPKRQAVAIDKNQRFQEALARFPAFARAVDDAMEDYRCREAAKQKLNGHFVSALTGLEGKQLGRFMQHLKSGQDDWVAYVMDCQDISKWITSEFEQFSKTP